MNIIFTSRGKGKTSRLVKSIVQYIEKMKKTKEPFFKPIAICINGQQSKRIKEEIRNITDCDIEVLSMEIGQYEILEKLRGRVGMIFMDDCNFLIETLLKQFFGCRFDIHTITLNNNNVKRCKIGGSK